MNEEQASVMECAENLRVARVEFSKAFLMSKVSADGTPVTDKTAEHRAIEMTGDEVTLREAELQVALMIAVRSSNAQSNSEA